MSYMAATAIRGKNVVGGQEKPTMPPQYAFPNLDNCENQTTKLGEEAIVVPEAYGAGPEVMDRKK